MTGHRRSARAVEERAQARPAEPGETGGRHTSDDRLVPADDRDAAETILWATRCLAPPEGVGVPELMAETGMSRPWVYQLGGDVGARAAARHPRPRRREPVRMRARARLGLLAVSGRGPAGLLAIEFAEEWQLSMQPAGLPVVTAYKQSPDGRHRRYLVAPSAGELLARLRAIREQEAGQ